MTLKQRTIYSALSRKIIWSIAIVSILTVAGYSYYSKTYLTTRSTTGSEVQTAIAQRENLVLSASGTGTLIASSDATFGFKTNGQREIEFLEQEAGA